jgi:hypothetical protein
MIRAAAHYAWRLVVSRLKASATLARQLLGLHTIPERHRPAAEELMRRAGRLNADWHAWVARVEADAPPLDERDGLELQLELGREAA